MAFTIMRALNPVIDIMKSANNQHTEMDSS